MMGKGENPFQSISLYETQLALFLVGSDVREEEFSVLIVDRSDSGKELGLSQCGPLSKEELGEFLSSVCNGTGKKKSVDLSSMEKLKAVGILGFIRFLDGFHLILITKATQVAQLGFHSLFKIEDTTTIYIPSESRSLSNEESRYVRMFQSVDVTSNFYFSPTYDLTHSLQENIVDRPTSYEEKYVWNSYLLRPLLVGKIDCRWILPVIHGYVKSCCFSIRRDQMCFLLIARRSNKFAGTRFLKRGANFEGQVANEVETEQIVFQTDISDFSNGRYTSFVLYRGSVPLIWSQDQKVVAKPPIQLDIVDPFASVSALHFQELINKYGNPVVVLNLVKRKEKRQREGILNDEFRSHINYLNQFLDPKKNICYISFDMARANKAGNVLEKLEGISFDVVKLNGWFQSFPPLYCHEIRQSPIAAGLSQRIVTLPSGRRVAVQQGISRTNCVDCTDRTNTAQFMVGKVALGFQLYSLGALEQPELHLDSESVRILETLYEEHGNILALQYAGSLLVHSVRSYKSNRSSGLQDRSRDVIQTLSRYYSNTFSDAEKQMAINLFLGIFRPKRDGPHLWDLSTDFYLHNANGFPSSDLCNWFSSEHSSKNDIPRLVRSSLSQESLVPNRELNERKASGPAAASELYDSLFDHHYQCHQLTSFDSLLSGSNSRVLRLNSLTGPSDATGSQYFQRLWKKSSSITDPSIGAKFVKTKEELLVPGDADNQDSSSDEEGNASDNDLSLPGVWSHQMQFERVPKDTGSVGSLLKNNSLSTTFADRQSTTAHCMSSKFSDLFPSVDKTYGFQLKQPSAEDMAKYANFCQFHKKANVGMSVKDQLKAIRDDTEVPFNLKGPISQFPLNQSSRGIGDLSVPTESIEIYRDAVICGIQGPKMPSARDLKLYSDYVALKRQMTGHL